MEPSKVEVVDARNGVTRMFDHVTTVSFVNADSYGSVRNLVGDEDEESILIICPQNVVTVYIEPEED